MTRSSGFVSRGHGSIGRFTLSRPTVAIDAAARMAAGAIAHAGGVNVVARLQAGHPVEELVHLGGIDQLRAIDVVGGRLSIGAAATHFEIETSPVVAAYRPDLTLAWRTVGNARIRRAGTIGGNLLAFGRDYDAAPILAAADATLHWVDHRGIVTTTEVVERYRSDLLVRIELPIRGRVVFDRSLKPMVSVAIGDDRIGIGCAYPDVVVRPRPASDEIESWLATMVEPTSDAFASGPYRRKMIGVLVSRLLSRHIGMAS